MSTSPASVIIIQPMNGLEIKIASEIMNSGPVTFARFMDLALYDPEFGYYSGGRLRVGREGDFFTSSHLHPAFGKMMGRQIRQMWEILGRPAEFSVVEMGPGEGYLCKDILDSMRGTDIFEAIIFHLVERGPANEQRQKRLLAGYPQKVRWLRSLREAGDMRGCLISNELLDAFPVHVVVMEEELREVYVDFDGSRFFEKAGPLSSEDLLGYMEEFAGALSPGYRTEVNLEVRDWLKGVSTVLREGFVLTIDYGYTARDYYSEEHNRGTLLCYRGHEVSEDPLVDVGEQDITAHVNFSALKKWGEGLGLKTIGFCGQGAFLVSLGIDQEVARLDADPRDYPFELARIKRLFLPQGLGESHLVMVQYKGEGAPDLLGFSIRNRARYL